MLMAPRFMPKRKKHTSDGRAALVHAIAHIELNAIDLAWDVLARFDGSDLPDAFRDDWVGIAHDEAKHFAMLEERLSELGCAYGDFPGHDGLWEAAEDTRDDLLARMAIVPMVLEARGLDTTPATVLQLRNAGDGRTADLLDVIARDEVSHVAAGVRWFEHLCRQHGLEPVDAFHTIVAARFRGALKPPFNESLRAEAGMRREYYAAHNTLTSHVPSEAP